MCLIIMREPNVTLDKKDFETAVLNNPDGWGLSVPDQEGLLYTQRSVTTNTDELYDLLHTEFSKDKLMLHLRYTTAGDTVLRNSHPFPILEKEADGVDMRMAHNGTLPRYKPAHNASNKWESDTRVLARTFVRPLFKRFALGMTSEDILSDPFIDVLLEDELTTASVLTFIDGYGNSTVINANGNGGFWDEQGTYFSNKYSFDENHRKGYGYGGTGYTMGKSKSSTPQKNDTGWKSTTESTTFADCNVQKFTEKFNIKDVDDLFLISDETIDELVQEDPESAVLLIKELLFLYQETDTKLTKATQHIRRKSKEIETLKKSQNQEVTSNDKAA